MRFDHSNALYIRLCRTMEAFREELATRTGEPLLVSERYDALARLYTAQLVEFAYLASTEHERTLEEALASLGDTTRRQLEVKLGITLEAQRQASARVKGRRPRTWTPEPHQTQGTGC